MAYKSGHNTGTAQLKVQNDILMAVCNQKLTALLLLDLSAIDTVSHTILLNHLQKTRRNNRRNIKMVSIAFREQGTVGVH